MAASSGPNIIRDNLQNYFESSNSKTILPDIPNLIPSGIEPDTSSTSISITPDKTFFKIDNSFAFLTVLTPFFHNGITLSYILKYPTDPLPNATRRILGLVPLPELTGAEVLIRWNLANLVQTNPNLTVGPGNGTTLKDNILYYTHVRESNGQFKNFVNGVLYNSDLSIIFPLSLSAISDQFQTLVIGNNFTGSLEDTTFSEIQFNNIMVYNRVLTDAEVLQNFNAFRTRYNYKYL